MPRELVCGLYTVCQSLFALPLGVIGRVCSVIVTLPGRLLYILINLVDHSPLFITESLFQLHICFPAQESPPEMGSTLKGKNLLLKRAILSFMSRQLVKRDETILTEFPPLKMYQHPLQRFQLLSVTNSRRQS